MNNQVRDTDSSEPLVLFFRLKYEKLTDGRRTPSDGNTSHDPLGQVS
jgi:hypothetical protein